eukprot:scaffold900_cov399-Pavlova_lutheri.AAC.12
MTVFTSANLMSSLNSRIQKSCVLQTSCNATLPWMSGIRGVFHHTFHGSCRLHCKARRQQAHWHTSEPTMGRCLDPGAGPTHMGFASNTNSQSRLIGLAGEQTSKSSLWVSSV